MSHTFWLRLEQLSVIFKDLEQTTGSYAICQTDAYN